MKNILVYGLLLVLVISGCSKDELPDSDYFVITTTGKKTISTTYVTKPIPTENGTFSLQYNKPGSIMFWVLGDSNNNSDVVISLSTVPVLNKVYKSSQGYNVYFGVYLDNVLVDSKGECSSEVIFSSFTFPGLIQGSIKSVKPDGTVVSSGEFNFISQ